MNIEGAASIVNIRLRQGTTGTVNLGKELVEEVGALGMPESTVRGLANGAIYDPSS